MHNAQQYAGADPENAGGGNEGLEAVTPAGSRGIAPGGRFGGEALLPHPPRKLDTF